MRKDLEPGLFDGYGQPGRIGSSTRPTTTHPLPKCPSDVMTSRVPFAERPTCTVKEACSAVGLGRTKLYQLIGGGAVDTLTIGRRRLVRVPSLLKLLAKGDM